MSKNGKRWLALVGLTTLLLTLLLVGQGLAQSNLTAKETLGEFLYFDENLSEPAGQACASCHLPSAGFVDPDKGKPVSEGVVPGMFGGRNSPASAYAMYAPMLHFDAAEGLWIGGQFWDGRATGDALGDPLADQALGPFTNPVEMHNPDKATVVRDALASRYGALFDQICGPVDLNDNDTVLAAYDCIALSIAEFERTSLFGQFSSKYDAYLQACLADGGSPDDCAQGIGLAAETAGQIFSKKEWAGLLLFVGENNNDGVLEPGEGAMCAGCHVANWTQTADYSLPVVVPTWAPAGMVPPVFTDFTYDNLGVPTNPEVYALAGGAPPDLGLGAIVDDTSGENENGKFKVMTLRNIGLTSPYAHNGLFKKLEDITHFYNTRDLLDDCDTVAKPKPGTNCWDPAEYPDTMNAAELGDLGLSEDDEDALVKFMKTLSDGWTP
jgi:cytochrome c peroxidase